MAKTFQVWAAVLGWYDGDTFYGAIDEGNRHFIGAGLKVVGGHIELEPIRERAALIQAPELDAPGGPLAKAYAEELAPPGLYPCITYKAPEEYGRPLVDLMLPGGLFSMLMLRAGHAAPYPRKKV